MKKNQRYNIAINLLIELIKTPSYSREEHETAIILENFFKNHSIAYTRIKNNFLAKNKNFDDSKKTVLLNSHHDTVKEGKSWTYDPFSAIIEGDKLIGLGTNDAGASLVSLLVIFLELYNKCLSYNLIMVISAEEEISGSNGLCLILSQLKKVDLGIIGEPTQMQMAIAEKGLIVLDCISKGKTGHAAREEGENALYKALDDIKWFRNTRLPLVSNLLGSCKMTVTQIYSGSHHNVIPDECNFVVDIRTNELYKNIEIIEYIKKNIQSKISPRSYHLNSSRINPKHPVVQKGYQLGLTSYGSPTLSDQSLMNFDTLKIGPGNSARSHTPDEYVLISEIKSGIDIYLKLLKFESL